MGRILSMRVQQQIVKLIGNSKILSSCTKHLQIMIFIQQVTVILNWQSKQIKTHAPFLERKTLKMKEILALWS